MKKYNIDDIFYCDIEYRKGYCIVKESITKLNRREITFKGLGSFCRMLHLWIWKNDVDNFNKCFKKQTSVKIICTEKDFKYLKDMHGIGCFYHKLSPLYEKLCIKQPKFVIFKNVKTKEQIILHLGKATKVLKRIGFEHDGDYNQIRVVKPMIKLQFIGEL